MFLFKRKPSKKSWLFLLVILFLILCFALIFKIKPFLKWPSAKLNSSTLIKTSSIKSLCREEVFLGFPSKTASSSQIDKLTKLMDSPIEWVFKDIHEQIVDLYCFRGKKPLVINFWATWCPPCVEELPSLSELANRHSDQIFVSAISAEPQQNIIHFLKQSFPALSPHLKIAQVSKEIQLERFPDDQLPVTYIFDKQGFLKAKEVGARDWSDKELVRQLLHLP